MFEILRNEGKFLKRNVDLNFEIGWWRMVINFVLMGIINFMVVWLYLRKKKINCYEN